VARKPSRVEEKRRHLPEVVVDLDDVQHYSSTERIRALSDGVFSIAMTLLAFTLVEHIPNGAPLSPADYRTEFLGPGLVYTMSFVVLGTFWIGHAIQFHYIVRSDRPLMVRTVLFLVFVSLVPFTAAYLGRFNDNPIAIVAYTANVMACGLFLQGTLLYATKDPLMLHPVMDMRIFRGIRAAYLAGPILYAIALALAFVNPWVAFGMCVAIPILTFFPNPFWGKVYRRVVGNARSKVDEDAGS
jgi:uncharacterized membrane protein